TVDNNQFTAEAGAVANNFGILAVTIQDAVNPSFTNNTITGHDYGVGLANVSTSNTITLGSSNAITNPHLAGVYLTNHLTFNPVGTTNLDTASGYSDPIAVVLDGLPVTGAQGVGAKVESVGPATAAMTVKGNSSIYGTHAAGSTGIEVLGAPASA